jgi:folate-binding protein YgfZ
MQMLSLRPEPMTHKQDAPFNGFPLPGWQVIEATGSGALAFLQAQLMNDVRALVPGYWQWNGWLNPKGRVIALFALVALDAERYWLIAPDFPAAELAERLQRFVFRSKVALTVRADCAASGAFAQPQQARKSAIHRVPKIDMEHVELDLGTDDGPRTLRIALRNASHDDMHAVAAGMDAIRWAAFDLAHGLPRLSAEGEAWTPQMLSLDRLAAYSLKKGCYPGQEIVARTHYLGQAKRGLVRIVGNQFSIGAEVSADGRVLGSVVCSIGNEALAVLSMERPAEGWTCANAPCAELPLLDGLAR